MKYMGSKAAHAAEIVAITCAGRRQGQAYVEPFVGGGNMIVCVDPAMGPRIGNDINWRMVALLDALGNRGWMPPVESITEKQYNEMKNNPDDYPPEMVAFVATGMAFSGKWFDVFARDKEGKRDYYQESRNFALRDAPFLRGIEFHSVSYIHFEIPPSSIVYCDPPYAGTLSYGGARTTIDVGQSLGLNTWDRTAFWRWADSLVDAGHRVYVSEYVGPSPSSYRSETPELAAEMKLAKDKFKIRQADPQSTREDRESAALDIKAVERRVAGNRLAQAARWAVLWEKEVVSSFDSGRGSEGKREVERLFHRAP